MMALDAALSRPDVHLPQLKTATPQADGQSDLRHLFAYQPRAMRHLLAFTQAVMREVGPLSPGECELIAAMTSKDNHCRF
jgi:alkylhydroperoxidase family enzyme